MSQLKMYWFPGTEIKEYELPEGYSFSKYKNVKDRDAWVEICRNGLVGDGHDGFRGFGDAIASQEDIDPERDMFFLDYKGEHIGTVTAFRHKATNVGDMHMVAIREDFRGRGLAKYLNFITQKKLAAEGVKYVFLTTDEWRKGAVKSYLSGGFRPVEYDEGMEDRWRAVLKDLGVPAADMVDDDGNFYKTITAAD